MINRKKRRTGQKCAGEERKMGIRLAEEALDARHHQSVWKSFVKKLIQKERQKPAGTSEARRRGA